MISIDVETGGLDPKHSALLSIGAVDMLDPTRTYYMEMQARYGAEVDERALKVNGFTQEEVDDPTKFTEEKAMHNFIGWVNECAGQKILLGHNASFDMSFIRESCKRYDIKCPFQHRVIDLHSVYYYEELRQKGFDIEAVSRKISLNYILKELFGQKEPNPHNALTGAKCNAEVMHALSGFRGRLFDDFLV
jgi:DNA polymerase-3 subunit alpha (Gram-positive type)